MSFHKRWIREENIRAIYESGGIKEVRRYFNADAIFLSDDFSRQIHDSLDKEDDHIEDLIKGKEN